ncbi:MAG: DNA repair protein RecN [Verrucomicrobiales bacterium]|nr:DNA repair protein RecN [Verrucomicrobiales bacterium]
MLTTLRIRNLALVEELTLEFPAGLVIVTGETGAGKSIILGALNLLLGQRADRSLIRSGADNCSVEGVFDIRSLPATFHELLAANGLEPCEEHQLLLKRAFSANGTNRQFINGSPTTLTVLATVGDWLVDMHGPHDHQSLLQPARQLAILDAYGNLGREVEAFGQRMRQRAGLLAEKEALVVDDETYARQLDLLRFQVREIHDAALKPDEVEAVEAEHQRCTNASALMQFAQALQSLLADEEESVQSRLQAMGRILHELHRLDPDTASLGEMHEQASALLQELGAQLADYVDRLELDPAQLEALEQRLNLIQGLKRKYGTNIEDVLRFGEEARTRLEQLEGREAEVARLNREVARLDHELLAAGKQLTGRRKALLPRLAKAVSQELSELGFARSRFQIGLETGGPPATGVTGFDTVEFEFAPNPGEPLRPLRAIASSGEMARVMLAIKTVLATEDQVPVLVFDEVDANIGGETAHAVGAKMRAIAAHRQVFCITHLAPVAAAAAAHYRVSKEVRGNRTHTRMDLLDPAARVTELARMMGGQTDAARKHAEALLETAHETAPAPRNSGTNAKSVRRSGRSAGPPEDSRNIVTD